MWLAGMHKSPGMIPSTTSQAVLSHICDHRDRKEDHTFTVIFSYIERLRAASATGDPVSTKQSLQTNFRKLKPKLLHSKNKQQGNHKHHPCKTSRETWRKRTGDSSSSWVPLGRWGVKQTPLISPCTLLTVAFPNLFLATEEKTGCGKRRQEKDQIVVNGRKEGRQGARLANIYWPLRAQVYG